MKTNIGLNDEARLEPGQILNLLRAELETEDEEAS